MAGSTYIVTAAVKRAGLCLIYIEVNFCSCSPFTVHTFTVIYSRIRRATLHLFPLLAPPLATNLEDNPPLTYLLGVCTLSDVHTFSTRHRISMRGSEGTTERPHRKRKVLRNCSLGPRGFLSRHETIGEQDSQAKPTCPRQGRRHYHSN